MLYQYIIQNAMVTRYVCQKSDNQSWAILLGLSLACVLGLSSSSFPVLLRPTPTCSHQELPTALQEGPPLTSLVAPLALLSVLPSPGLPHLEWHHPISFFHQISVSASTNELQCVVSAFWVHFIPLNTMTSLPSICVLLQMTAFHHFYYWVTFFVYPTFSSISPLMGGLSPYCSCCE